jgi:hypothetical protein
MTSRISLDSRSPSPVESHTTACPVAQDESTMAPYVTFNDPPGANKLDPLTVEQFPHLHRFLQQNLEQLETKV